MFRFQKALRASKLALKTGRNWERCAVVNLAGQLASSMEASQADEMAVM